MIARGPLSLSCPPHSSARSRAARRVARGCGRQSAPRCHRMTGDGRRVPVRCAARRTRSRCRSLRGRREKVRQPGRPARSTAEVPSAAGICRAPELSGVVPAVPPWPGTSLPGWTIAVARRLAAHRRRMAGRRASSHRRSCSGNPAARKRRPPGRLPGTAGRRTRPACGLALPRLLPHTPCRRARSRGARPARDGSQVATPRPTTTRRANSACGVREACDPSPTRHCANCGAGACRSAPTAFDRTRSVP